MTSKYRVPTEFDTSLREVACDEKALARALAAAEEESAFQRGLLQQEPCELYETRLARARQRQAELLSLAGRFDQALTAIDEALATWESHRRPSAHFLARLKRALIVAHHPGNGHIKQALSTLEELLKKSEESEAVYRDFVHEALGRVHLFDGNRHRSLHHLSIALELRRDRGNQRHIDKTRQMIQIAVAGREDSPQK